MSEEEMPGPRRQAGDPCDLLPQSGEWDGETLPDRRRPGRIRDINPALTAMLRRPAEFTITSHEGHDDEPFRRDDLQPARGIIFAVGTGLVCWAVLMAVAVWVVG